MCASSKGSGEAAYIHRQSGHGLIEYSIEVQKSHDLAHFVIKEPFFIKSSRSSLFSDQNKLRLVTFNGQHMSFWYVSHMREVALKWGSIP